MAGIADTLQIARTFCLNRFIDKLEAEKIIKEFGTPVYVIDEQTLHEKVRELLDAYNGFKGRVNVAYSIKANFNPSLLKAFMKDNIMFDATSTGEMHFYTKCNGDPKNIVYTSVTEETEEYEHVLRTGVTRIVVSSYNGLLNLIDAAKRVGVKPRTMIRINPEVGVKAEVRASYRHGKFGVPFNTSATDSATNILRHILQEEILEFEGFHFHLGSQITDFTCFSNALEKLDSFIAKMKKEHPEFRFHAIDIGGGTPIFYGDPVPAPKEIASSIISKLNHMAETHGDFMLIIESGRYLTAESTVLISRVVNTKEYSNDKFVILDTGYHLLLDAALLKQEYPQETLHLNNGNNNANKSTGNGARIHLAGRLCDTYDVFPVSKASTLKDPEKDSYVIFYNVGAYSIVFNMPFHCQTKPAVVMKKSDGTLSLARKATTIDQLFAEEGGNLDLNF